MLKKRLIGVVTVKTGWAVQSFGYQSYLPLGKPECLVENLDRWGADEILVLCIDRSVAGLGPDFGLLERLGKLGLDTPLIYGGGIRSVKDGARATALGADRIVVDALLQDDIGVVRGLAEKLGSQAIIGCMPFSNRTGSCERLDYRGKKTVALTEQTVVQIEEGAVSEVLLVDWENEGQPNSFDQSLLHKVGMPVGVPLIVFGGISEAAQIKSILMSTENVSAVAVGNFLNYKEHSVQNLKHELLGASVRPPAFETENSILSYV